MTMSKDISGGSDTTSHQCHVQVADRAGVHTCKHKGTYFEDGKHWCPLHAPSNVAKKAERKVKKDEEKAAAEAEKAAGRAEKLAKKQAPLDGDGPIVAATAIELPATLEEAARVIVDLADEAQAALAAISNMTSAGWPDNTPAENYKVMLQTVNDEAKKSSENIRLRIWKAREILDPAASPSG